MKASGNRSQPALQKTSLLWNTEEEVGVRGRALGSETGVGLVLGWPPWGVKFLYKRTFTWLQDLWGLSGCEGSG